MTKITHVRGYWRKLDNGKVVWVRPHDRVIESVASAHDLGVGESSALVFGKRVLEDTVKDRYKDREKTNFLLDGYLLKGDMSLDEIADRLSVAGLADNVEDMGGGVYKLSQGWGEHRHEWYYHASPETYIERRRESDSKKFFYGKKKTLKRKFNGKRPDGFIQAAGWLVGALGLRQRRNVKVNHYTAIKSLANRVEIGGMIPTLDVNGDVSYPDLFQNVGYGLRWGINTGRVLVDAKKDLVWPKTRKRLSNFEFAELLTRLALESDKNESSAGIMRAYLKEMGMSA